MKKIWWVIIVIALLCLSIGGKIYMNSINMKKEMLAVVKSDEAKEVYERTIKNLDSKGLTPDGVIISYDIDYESVERNPMGGIMLDLIVNNSSTLRIDIILEKNTDSSRLKNGWGGVSKELDKLLNEVDDR